MRVRQLGKRFRDTVVFDGLDADFRESGITAVLGPSGCGKTTLLNLLAGMTSPDSGSVETGAGRVISYLFQEPRLLPWFTVRQNVEFVLRERMGNRERSETVGRVLSLVGLEGSADAYPRQLSGGMKQRAALARAFAFPSDIILMDEPFQALDLALKLSLLDAFEDLWTAERRTAVFVTHDIQEAILLGDVIMILSQRPARIVGRLENPVPGPGRDLRDRSLLELERELYRIVLAGSSGRSPRGYAG